MANVIHGLNRDNLVRSLAAHGTILFREDFGQTYVLDGKVWLIDKTSAENLGDYFEYRDKVRNGLRPISNG